MLALPTPLVGIKIPGFIAAPRKLSSTGRTSKGSRHDSNPIAQTSPAFLSQSVKTGSPSLGFRKDNAKKLTDSIWELAVASGWEAPFFLNGTKIFFWLLLKDYRQLVLVSKSPSNDIQIVATNSCFWVVQTCILGTTCERQEEGSNKSDPGKEPKVQRNPKLGPIMR